jgi:hypothetical protein
VGLAFLLGGIALIVGWNRSQIVVSNSMLTAVECVGPFRWRRRRAIADIERLILAPRFGRQVPESATAETGQAKFGSIVAMGDQIESMVLAPDYPHRILAPLTSRLARMITDCTATKVVVEEHDSDPLFAPEDVIDEALAPEEPERVPDQAPDETSVICRREGNGVVFAVPPLGLRKGGKGLFGFSVLWNGFMLIFTTVAVVSFIKEPGTVHLGKALFPGLILLLFVAVGVGMFLGAYNMGRRQAAIVADHRQLDIKRIGPFGSREYVFRKDNLESICRGPSGMSVNDVPIMELQIVDAAGKKTGMLSQLEDSEIEWIAASLRQVLGLPAR